MLGQWSGVALFFEQKVQWKRKKYDTISTGMVNAAESPDLGPVRNVQVLRAISSRCWYWFPEFSLALSCILLAVTLFTTRAIGVTWIPEEDSIRSSSGMLDPAPGVQVTLPKTDCFGAKIKRDLGSLLIAAATCFSCCMEVADPSKDLFHGQVVFLVETSKATDLPPEFARRKGNTRVVINPAAKAIGKALNAYWPARWYLLDSKGRLSSMQRSLADTRPTEAKL